MTSSGPQTRPPPLDVRLQIVRQESVTQDVNFANGQTKVVHSCIKGSPFKLELALVGNFDRSIINFNRFVITAVLLYDSSSSSENGRAEERQVSFVKTRPLEVLEYSVNETGDRLTLLVVLNVLSSQHEHSLFVIKIANADLGLVAASQPIRVVSKELQLKGKKDKTRKAPAGSGPAAARRPLTEDVLETLHRIEGQGHTHHQLLLTVLDRLAAAEATSSLTPQTMDSGGLGERRPSLHELPGEPAHKRQKKDDYNNNNGAAENGGLAQRQVGASPPQASFAANLTALVRSFGALPREQRSDIVRRAVRTCPDRETMSDMLGHLAAAGMMGSFGLANLNNGGMMPFPAAPPSLTQPIKPEPPAELGDQVLDVGQIPPTATNGASPQLPFGTRLPSLPPLPYMPTYEGNNASGSSGSIGSLLPPSLSTSQPLALPSLGLSTDQEELQRKFPDVDSNKLYNDIFATWPYDSLNLSQ